MKERPIISVSFLEVYNEVIYDLLDPTSNLVPEKDAPKLKIVSDEVNGLCRPVVKDEAECIKYFFHGNNLRHVDSSLNKVCQHTTIHTPLNYSGGYSASTRMNTFSSRSHSIFTFYMLGPRDPPGTLPVKLVFVDLAGSERNDRTKSEGTALQEAKKINASLLALEKVILGFERSYEGNSFHIPFRESKLTMLLKDLFIGEALFAIVCNISPEKADLPETLNALLFCSRCKNLKIKIRAAQKPRVTIQTDDSPLSRALDEENQLLRAKIRKLENELANEQAEKEELRKELQRVKASNLGEIPLTEEILEEYKRKVGE